MESRFILVKGAREHNLKHIDVKIPKKKLVVMTGVSGSGKSSVAFDTIYAEGQRRYVESLSSYARQFLGQMPKPQYDTIQGLSPSISIEQKSVSKNPRSTVGTITEIYDYLRVLFAKLGRQYCPECHIPVSKMGVDEIVQEIKNEFSDLYVIMLSPLIHHRKGEYGTLLDSIKKDGFNKVYIDQKPFDLEEKLPVLDKKLKHSIELEIDSLEINHSNRSRLVDSLETALMYGSSYVIIKSEDGKKTKHYSSLNACPNCKKSFKVLTHQAFSFNSPLGMCSVCNGLGINLEVDMEKVILDENLSIQEGVIRPWTRATSEGSGFEGALVYEFLKKHHISTSKPWKQFTQREKQLIYFGTLDQTYQITYITKDNHTWNFPSRFEGVVNRITRKFKETENEGIREKMLQYFSEMPCRICQGSRLKSESLNVFISQKNIFDLCRMNIADLKHWFLKAQWSAGEAKIGSELIKEIRNRIQFLLDVGLNYLDLNRRAPSLSGGESQRIRLASQISTELSGVLYVLDEPSIGLHQRDNFQLIASLKRLRDLGNTVLVIEHDQDTIMNSDYIIDFGPKAGSLGGEVVAEGEPQKFKKAKHSLTAAYLRGELKISLPLNRRKGTGKRLTLLKPRANNLKMNKIDLPLGKFICVTGVSGAGKSTLINDVLYPLLKQGFENTMDEVHHHLGTLKGIGQIKDLIYIDQSPIGRSSRSNPVTYTKVYDHIRELFSLLPLSKARGYAPGRFSFNVKGGRCDHCEGGGQIMVEMHFLPDVFVECEVCGGKRFNENTLEVKFKGKSIADILNLSVYEAKELFENQPKISQILDTLMDVGMDYVPLGQPSTTLSGGEAQRIKLSRELAKRKSGDVLYILDEPTTGLHFDDINKLLKVLHKFVDQGNTVIVIEHNLDVIKTSDFVIDLGPEGGMNGGELVISGTPEAISHHKQSHTGKYLKSYL